MGKRTGPERRLGGAVPLRNRRRAVAKMRAPVEDFGQPVGSLVELVEGKRRGGRGVSVGAAKRQIGQAFTQIEGGSNGGLGQSPAGISDGGGRRLTGGSRCQRAKKRARRTPSGVTRDGPWADFEAGPNRSPRPFILFRFLFGFLFPVFCFYFYLLQKCFKSIQTSFRNFLKFLALF
jgi:hypothetical protein